MNNYRTEQEAFWAGHFGDDYAARNRGDHLIASNLALFAKVLARMRPVHSVIEFGANVGLNLVAIRQLLPDAKLSAVEINEAAVVELRKMPELTVYDRSIMDFSPEGTHDLVLSKGVLIHLDPDKLPGVYDLLHRSSGRYICLAEYYNPTPMSVSYCVSYRGHTDRLFKRDFAGEMLDRFDDLRVVDYGFVYHRDIAYPQDDVTWFLLEKRTEPTN
jgi:pseudaminic acid biosynthesis-associated methylase